LTVELTALSLRLSLKNNNPFKILHKWHLQQRRLVWQI
jgi:hypothetical protein